MFDTSILLLDNIPMFADEVIMSTFEVIARQAQLTSKHTPVTIKEEKVVQAGIEQSEVETVIRKLQDEFKCIKVLKWPERQTLSSDLIDEAIRTSLGEFTEADFVVDDSYVMRIMPKFERRYEALKKSMLDEALPLPSREVGKFATYADGTVTYNKKSIELEPKQRLITHLLISRHPYVVPQNDMIEMYWNDENKSESEYLDSATREKLMKNIYDCISKTRKILEALDGEKRIKTIPRHGYKFLA